MRRRKALPVLLLVVTFACGRSGIDDFPSAPQPSGNDATAGMGPDGASSSSGSGSGSSSSGGSPASSSGASSGSSSGSSHGGVEAGPPPPPSCAVAGAGRTNCGPGGSGDESCCESLEVPGGTFYRTYAYEDGGGPTGESDPATVSGFRLDKYLVTVGRFREFVSAWDNGSGLDGGPGYEPTAASGRHAYLNGGLGLVSVNGSTMALFEPGWLVTDDIQIAPTTANLTTYCFEGTMKTWTPSAANNENLPINCVTWWDAYAFCIWDGGFLPSEAEWEYAAAGGGDPLGQREYPWGSTPPGTANDYAIYGCHYGTSDYDLSDIAPVGTATLGGGYWGHLDLAGEMNEYVADWYADSYYPCTDCAYLVPDPIEPAPTYRVVRGGDFCRSSTLFSAARSEGAPGDRDYYVGFRCARAP